MNRRWLDRLLRRSSWIQDAVERGLRSWARESGGIPRDQPSTREVTMSPDPRTETLDPRETPSFG